CAGQRGLPGKDTLFPREQAATHHENGTTGACVRGAMASTLRVTLRGLVRLRRGSAGRRDGRNGRRDRGTARPLAPSDHYSEGEECPLTEPYRVRGRLT